MLILVKLRLHHKTHLNVGSNHSWVGYFEVNKVSFINLEIYRFALSRYYRLAKVETNRWRLLVTFPEPQKAGLMRLL
jgi:hypothetical protein